jgi:hypothetical protein
MFLFKIDRLFSNSKGLILIMASLNFTQHAFTEDRTKLLGIWKLVSFEAEFQDTGELRPIFGNSPRGYMIFTPEGRMMALITAEGRKTPKTNEDQSGAFSTMLAYSGMYRIEGDKFITKVDVSWNEAWASTEQIRFFKLEGDHLHIFSAWAPSPIPTLGSGRIARGILVWERAK